MHPAWTALLLGHKSPNLLPRRALPTGRLATLGAYRNHDRDHLANVREETEVRRQEKLEGFAGFCFESRLHELDGRAPSLKHL